MIPKLDRKPAQTPIYLEYLERLKSLGFKGEINTDTGNRTALATDNSIYQLLPQAVVYPKDIEDLCQLSQLVSEARFHSVVLSPRGGGTGTNGQSLTDGIVVDISKHMNQILEINQAERWVRVQAGVVKDQLNAALKHYGLFFAPELSTSNRATIGGMINTDASGQGSCLYGKTRDHVLELNTVLLDGSVLQSHALTAEQFQAQCEEQTRSGLIHRLADNINTEYKDLIEQKFPKLNRCLTGYDLAHIRDKKGRFNLNNLLCGSEGTLGFIAEAKLNLLPIPKFSALVVVKYGDFNAALRDAKRLMQAKPTSIETIDSKVLNLAMDDIVWHDVEEFFPVSAVPVQGINLVEYTADSELELKQKLTGLKQTLKQNRNPDAVGQSLVWGSEAVNRIWAMRKRAVGLLGNAKGEARPIPFVEDTAVPPEHLADFILEFRALLDQHNLAYGMFGHVDAGVLHVRPAIDMKDPEQALLVREISDQVAELTQKYHGLLWGEHGKGVRSEYAPKFFGELYPQLQRIKAAFDPNNQLNPGKIATPDDGSQLLRIDEVSTRGQLDRDIPVQVWQGYSDAVYCNGNGACYNWNYNDPMCPSWKVTRERIHSPKGRASLIREWLRQCQELGYNPETGGSNLPGLAKSMMLAPRKWLNSWQKARGHYDFSHDVHEAMQGCLACKSCSGQCPIKVDVPSFRSKFLALYHTRYSRPLKDYLVASLEFALPLAAKAPPLYNGLMSAPPVKWLLSKVAGFEDAPLVSKNNLAKSLRAMGIKQASLKSLEQLPKGAEKRQVILIQDAFTSYFDSQVVIDSAALLQKLGFSVWLAPFKPNGKPLHVHGFLRGFNKVASKQAQMLAKLSQSGIALVGVDPAMTLTYRAEYLKALGVDAVPEVKLLQEFLLEHIEDIRQRQGQFQAEEFKLLPHCTEKTTAPAALNAWKAVFEALGQKLQVINVGCCGMSGTYGHERQHRERSAQLFAMSWKAPVSASENQAKICATGYSCRSQTKREAFVNLPHPAQLLLRQHRS